MFRWISAGRMMLAVVLGVSLILTGCSMNWVSEAEEIVAALIPAAANILTLVATLEGKTVSAQDMATVQNSATQADADLQLIQSLIAAYQNAEDSAKPGIMNQIQSAINAVQANLQGLLPALHIKDAATETKIAAVVGIVLAEVQSLAAVVPILQGAGGQGAVAAHVASASGHGVAVAGSSRFVKAPLSAREFVKSYNATLTAKTGNADLDRATARLQIHSHSAVERWASAGVLK